MTNTDPLNIEKFATDNGIDRDEMMLGIVMSGVILHMGADPIVRELLANNDFEQFVEKFESSPELARKFDDALMAVRELATD